MHRSTQGGCAVAQIGAKGDERFDVIGAGHRVSLGTVVAGAVGRVRFRRFFAPPPPPGFAGCAGLRRGGEHVGTALGVGELESLPPLHQLRLGLAAARAQAEKVVGSAKPWVFDQTVGIARGAAFEARLQRPDFAHVGGDAPLDGQALGLSCQHFVSGLIERHEGGDAFGQQRVPALLHVMPKQAGEEEAGAGGLALGDALVGVLQRIGDEALALGLFQHGIEQRQQTVMQAQATELLQRGDRMAGLQQLDGLVEQASGRHIGEQIGAGADGRERGRVDIEAEFGGKAGDAQHAHRVFAVAGGGVADHAQAPLFEVFHAPVVVDHHVADRVVIERVDGEVAALGIVVERAPDVVAQHAAAAVHRQGLVGQGAA